MKRAWKIALLAAALILLFVGAASMTMAAQQKAGFTDEEKQLINTYYRRLVGTLAPGSIDRKPLSVAIEQGLKIGERLPMPLEKKIERLPEKLESQLPLHGAEFKRYHVGNHVVLVKMPEWTLVDIIRDAGMK